MTLTSAPSRWTIDLASLVADLPPLEPQPPPSIRRALLVPSTAVCAKPLPHLPIELVATVLAFADPATLAVACRVGWDWLREASPVLYETVVIDRHDAFEGLFLQRDAPVSLALEPYLSLHQIRHLKLLVQPSTPPSTSRLSRSSSPPPHPLELDSLAISCAYTGLVGYAPFLALVRPRAVSFRPFFRRSSKFDFLVEQRSWEIVTGEWMRAGRLASVVCVGCNLTCRMRVSVDGHEGDGDDDDDEADRRLVERFIAVPPRRPPGDAPPLQITYDLTALPALTTPFYRHFLVQRSIDAVFTIPGLAERGDDVQPRAGPRGVKVVVKRRQELEWVREGLALIRPEERPLVTVELAPGASEVGPDAGGGGGGSSSKAVGGRVALLESRDVV